MASSILSGSSISSFSIFRPKWSAISCMFFLERGPSTKFIARPERPNLPVRPILQQCSVASGVCVCVCVCKINKGGKVQDNNRHCANLGNVSFLWTFTAITMNIHNCHKRLVIELVGQDKSNKTNIYSLPLSTKQIYQPHKGGKPLKVIAS